MGSKKAAVFFPGIGYGLDRPLLYYAKKIALHRGYETIDVPYTGFPKKVRGDRAKMKEAFDIAMSQTEEILKDVDFSEYKDIIFVSKSVGTVVAAHYAHEHDITVNHVFFTPLEETFMHDDQKGVVFHGTNDPWADTLAIQKRCAELKLPLNLYDGANHSLETGDVAKDLQYLTDIMMRLLE
jgi:hypothetical protein